MNQPVSAIKQTKYNELIILIFLGKLNIARKSDQNI